MIAWNMFRIEQIKLLKSRLLWALLGLLGLLMAVLFGAMVVVSLLPDAPVDVAELLLWPDALLNMLSFGAGNFLGGLLVAVLAGAIVAQEYTWRTFSLWLGRGVPRAIVLMAKFAALLIAVLLVVLVPLLVGGVLSAFATAQIAGSLDIGQISLAGLALSLLRTAYSLLPYLALTFLLAVATRSTVAAVGGGIAYALLIEIILVQGLGLFGGAGVHLSALLPGMLAASLATLNSVTAPAAVVVSEGPLLPPAFAATLIALYTAVLMGAALLIFRRQDLAT